MNGVRRLPRQIFYQIYVPVDAKCLKPVIPALIGLCLGITMCMMYAPYSEDSCETYVSKQDPQEWIKVVPKSLDDDAKAEENFKPRLVVPEQKPKSMAAQSLAHRAPLPAQSKKLVRPRYASTELGIREKLFVAVITSKTTIDTLGVAFNKTVHHLVTKMVFFMADKGPTLPSGMAIVSFSDMQHHLVPVHTLKYISEHYPDTYDYYMFVSDRTYIRGDKLYDLMEHISVSQHLHMGVPKTTDTGETYCSLEGGFVISQSLLSLALAQLDYCTAHFRWLDPSLNMGKCLLHATEMSCVDQIGTTVPKQYTHFKVKDFDFDDDIGKLKQNEAFNASISVYPMPDDMNHYKLHRYFCLHELNETQQEIEKTKESILYLSQFAPGGRDSVSWPIGVPEPYKPKNRFDVIRWEYFTETHIYFQDDFTNVKELKGVDRQDIGEVIKLSVNYLNEKYENKLLYSRLLNGYRRFDPQRGMEYTLDLALREVGDHGQEVQKRVHLVRPLGQVELIPMPYVTENTRVNLVLPVTEEDKDGVGNFLDSYAHTCLDPGDNTHLLVVFIYSSGSTESSFSVLKSMINYYEKKYQNAGKLAWAEIHSNASYLPEFTIVDAVATRLQPDALILMCTIGMELATEYFNRVRMNTIAGWQVFFPIGFWQYKPNLIYDKKPYPITIDITSKTGHYDPLGFEHSSFYLSDYLEARKNMRTEDFLRSDLFDLFIHSQKLHVFRAVEPALKHRYRHFNCLPTSPQRMYERCLNRRAEGLATRAQLARLVFEFQEKQTQPPPHH